MKRAIAFIMILCLALSFAGCAADKEKPYTGGETAGSDLTGSGGARIFTPRTIPLPDLDSRAMRAVKAGERVFLYARDDKTNHFYFMGADSSVTKADIALENAVVSIDGDAAGNAYVLSLDAEGAYILTQIDPSMEAVSRKLDFLSEVEDAVWDITVTDSGYLVETVNNVLCYDRAGQAVGALGPFDGAFDLIKNRSEIILTIPDDSNTAFRVLGQGFETAASYAISQGLSGISPGAQDGHVFACHAGIIYDIDYATGNAAGYANSYASGESGNFIYLSDDKYFSIENREAKIYEAAAEGAAGEIKTLTLATYAPDDYEIRELVEAARRFNETGAAYRIDIANYGMYDNGSDGNGLQRLYTDITAGNTPDIYDLSVLSYQSFYRKGLLEDLYPYFNSSENVHLDDLTASVIQALEYNGALYTFVPAHSTVMMFGPSTVADPNDWRPERFIEIAGTSSMDLFGRDVTRAEYLRYLLTLTGNEYIDIENASCNFVNSSFPAMLAIAAGLPDSYDRANASSDDWGRIFNGKQMFSISARADIMLGLCCADGAYCGNAVTLGFPSVNNGIAVSPYLNLGMSANSESKDGVWRFFEYLLSDEYQSDLRKALPLKKNVLNARLESLIEKASGTSRVMGFDENTLVEIPCSPPSSVQKEEALRILSRIDCVDYCDNELYDLALREATPFFEGGISAEKAAENMQSKVSIYLSEQYG